MIDGAKRHFPYVAGPLGWVAAALLVAGILCQIVAGLLALWIAVSRDTRLVAPLIAAFVVSPLFVIGALAIWRIGWKGNGTLQSLLPREQQRATVGAITVMYLAGLLGMGGYILLWLELPGYRGLFIAIVPLILGVAVADFGSYRMRQLRQLKARTTFGWSARREVVVYTGVSVVAAALFLAAGLFWVRN